MAGGEHHLELPPRPASAARARRFVKTALDDADASSREIGVLLASELVTNAVLYAQGSITVRVSARDAAFRVAVTDGTAGEVQPRQVGIDATSGRGLALVERLASAWGVEVSSEGDGKEVWFEVPRSA